MGDLRVLNWNMQHNPKAWDRLDHLRSTHHVDVALLQEAARPQATDWLTWPRADDPVRWELRSRSDLVVKWSSAVAVRPDEGPDALVAQEVPMTALFETPATGFATSHPGQFAVVDLEVDGRRVTLISLYGIWDRHDGNLFSEATLHRAISDLTPLLQDRERRDIVVAGDFNIFVDWENSSKWGGVWAHRSRTVFDRFAAYGLELAGPTTDRPLKGCICRQGDECRHVRTFAHNRNPRNGSYQIDYVMATASMARDVVASETLDPDIELNPSNGAEKWRWSDHLPVLTSFHW